MVSAADVLNVINVTKRFDRAELTFIFLIKSEKIYEEK